MNGNVKQATSFQKSAPSIAKAAASASRHRSEALLSPFAFFETLKKRESIFAEKIVKSYGTFDAPESPSEK